MRVPLMLGALAALPLAAAIAAPPSPPPAAPAAWAKCTICHANTRGGGAEIGPNLWGVGGARAGTRPGFAYSPALRKTGLTWNRATLMRWLNNGQAVAPGTTMPNQTLSPSERDALIQYLLALK